MLGSTASRIALLPLILCFVPLAAQETAAWKDPSPHKISFITVDKDVRLEVLDWGGSGRPLVLLTGLEDNAHVFDDFAPKLTSEYHVLGITRRGYGASTIAASGYDANRLGDDVLAVVDSLKLENPVLVGHSIAGEELSSVGSRHPDRVAGLIYLDAAYPYAFDNGKGTPMTEIQELAKDIPARPQPSSSDLASYAAMRDWWERTRGVKMPEAFFRQARPPNPDGTPGKQRTPPGIGRMVQDQTVKFSQISVPVLALYAMPQRLPRYLLDVSAPDARAAVETFARQSQLAVEKQIKAFEQGVPHSRVVRIANADHRIYITNEAEVLREMRAFLSALK